MEIYLIRHTTPQIEKGICYGQSDLALANSFSDEAEAVLKKLPHSFDMVYSSPLLRCSKLAALIDSNYKTDSRLMELNFGDWELKKWDDIPNLEIQPWYNDFVNTPCLGGESYRDLYKRVIPFYEKITSYHQYKKIALVTHSGVIRCLFAHYNHIALKDSFNDFNISYGEHIVLDI